MPLEVELEPDESLVFQDGVGSSRPMVLAVTNKAVFVTREKHFAKESWYLDRIPIRTVTQVSLQPERPLVLWGISFLIFLGGFILFAGMELNVYRQLPGTKVSPWPVAFMVIGEIMPFLAKGRKILVVQTGEKQFKWKPSFLADKPKVKELQQGFLNACRVVGIHIFGEVR